jgi:hypothetical protein
VTGGVVRVFVIGQPAARRGRARQRRPPRRGDGRRRRPATGRAARMRGPPECPLWTPAASRSIRDGAAPRPASSGAQRTGSVGGGSATTRTVAPSSASHPSGISRDACGDGFAGLHRPHRGEIAAEGDRHDHLGPRRGPGLTNVRVSAPPSGSTTPAPVEGDRRVGAGITGPVAHTATKRAVRASASVADSGTGSRAVDGDHQSGEHPAVADVEARRRRRAPGPTRGQPGAGAATQVRCSCTYGCPIAPPVANHLHRVPRGPLP